MSKKATDCRLKAVGGREKAGGRRQPAAPEVFPFVHVQKCFVCGVVDLKCRDLWAQPNLCRECADTGFSFLELIGRVTDLAERAVMLRVLKECCILRQDFNRAKYFRDLAAQYKNLAALTAAMQARGDSAGLLQAVKRFNAAAIPAAPVRGNNGPVNDKAAKK